MVTRTRDVTSEPAAFALALALCLSCSRGLFDERGGLRASTTGVEAALRDNRARARPGLKRVEECRARPYGAQPCRCRATRFRSSGTYGAYVRPRRSRRESVPSGCRAPSTSASPAARRAGRAGEDDVFQPVRADAWRYARRAPSTASEMFDLPDPFGPTIAVMPGSSVSALLSAKDLKRPRTRDEVHPLALLLLKACGFLLSFDAGALGGASAFACAAASSGGSGGCLLGLGCAAAFSLGSALFLRSGRPKNSPTRAGVLFRNPALGLLLHATGAAGKSLVTRVDHRRRTCGRAAGPAFRSTCKSA